MTTKIQGSLKDVPVDHPESVQDKTIESVEKIQVQALWNRLFEEQQTEIENLKREKTLLTQKQEEAIYDLECVQSLLETEAAEQAKTLTQKEAQVKTLLHKLRNTRNQIQFLRGSLVLEQHNLEIAQSLIQKQNLRISVLDQSNDVLSKTVQRKQDELCTQAEEIKKIREQLEETKKQR